MTPSELPPEIDSETTLYSYGSLLERDQLRAFLEGRGEFEIRDAVDVESAVSYIKEYRSDVVILRNVRLDNVRVSIITDAMLSNRFNGRLSAAANYLYVCARLTKLGEHGRHVMGGLICGLRADELETIDRYELFPVMQRVPARSLTIHGVVYNTSKISFYSGAIMEVTAQEREQRAELMSRGRQAGELSPQARWSRDIRSR